MVNCKVLKKKKIYFILTYTGTLLARIIRLYTKTEFSHISISLDKRLWKMYSFGRLNPYNPFYGGFVHESIYFGTFKRFKMTSAQIYELEVTEEQYNKILKTIKYIKTHKNLYHFNIIGLFAAGFNKKIKSKNSFYCAEFVKYLLEYSGIQFDLPEIVKPEDFKKLNNINLIYQGKLSSYNKN